MKYTAGQAAKAAGVATSTITKACKSGKISWERDENGVFQIDPSELHRVYPPKESKPLRQVSIERHATPQKEAENRGLERLVDSLQEQLADLRTSSARALADLRADKDQAIEFLREDRDNWQQQAKRLTLLVSPVTTAAPDPVPVSASDAATTGHGRPVARFWHRWLGVVPSNG